MKPPGARPDTAQPLLPRQQQGLSVSDAHHQAAAAAHPGGRSFPWPTAAIFSLLTFNSGMAVYRSQGDREKVAFVAFSYLDLLALFFCHRSYETAGPGSRLKGRLKVALWLLATALTHLFSFKVAAVIHPAIAVAIWLMAVATIAGGFYAFFSYNDN